MCNFSRSNLYLFLYITIYMIYNKNMEQNLKNTMIDNFKISLLNLSPRVMLTGSRAWGVGTDESDFDILIPRSLHSTVINMGEFRSAEVVALHENLEKVYDNTHENYHVKLPAGGVFNLIFLDDEDRVPNGPVSEFEQWAIATNLIHIALKVEAVAGISKLKTILKDKKERIETFQELRRNCVEYDSLLNEVAF